MPMINVNGIDLYYEEHGTGVPIFVIHGTSSSALIWRDAVPELASRGRCIVYDRRGCFRSQRPEPYDRTDVAEHGADAAALIQELGAAPAIVIGRSYGGETALDLVRRRPQAVSALVLLEAAVLTLDPEAMAWAQPLKAEVLATAERDMSAVGETFLRAVVGDDTWESFPPELKEMFTQNGPAIAAEFRGRWLEMSEDELRAITQPTLIVSGKDSPEALRRVSSRMAKLLPNCETLLVDGGHLVNPAHPDVLAFIDRVRKA
jgi:pimeloyl-ACP methyl ester carboxylesterase